MRKTMEQTMRVTMAVAAGTLLLTGCMAGPELVAQGGALQAGAAVEVPSAIWRQVDACAGPEVREALGLASVEGEPALAALIDLDGAVRCVDARVTLEEDGLVDVELVELDPAYLPRTQPAGLSVERGTSSASQAEGGPALLGEGPGNTEASSQPQEPIGNSRVPNLPSLWLGTQAASGDPVPEPM